MSLLEELRAAFPAFPGAAIRDGEYAPLLAGLGIPGTLALAGADGWTERDGEIRLDGSVSTPVLGVANAPIAITFAPSGQDYALTLPTRNAPIWVRKSILARPLRRANHPNIVTSTGQPHQSKYFSV